VLQIIIALKLLYVQARMRAGFTGKWNPLFEQLFLCSMAALRWLHSLRKRHAYVIKRESFTGSNWHQ